MPSSVSESHKSIPQGDGGGSIGYLAALLAVFPDFDAFSSAAYGARPAAGHRGITHSLVFALWLAFLAASLTFRLLAQGTSGC